MAFIPPRFGYVLQAASSFAGPVGWGNQTAYRLFYRLSPRYSLPVAGIAVYVTQTGSGQADAYLYHDIAGPLWDTANYETFLLSGYGVNRVALPSSPGRLVISGLNYPVTAGAGYQLGIRHNSTAQVNFFNGFDHRVSDWAMHGYQESSSLVYTGTNTIFHGQYNAQILYRMPDGSVKYFEPLLTGQYTDNYTTSGLSVRFTVPSGVNLNVRGFTFAHFTRQGTPGGLYITVKQGSNTVAQSDPLASSFVPPSTSAGLSFYIPLLNQPVLLSGGVTYDVGLGVSGVHDTSNRFAMKTLSVDTSCIPDWWTFRMVIGGAEQWGAVPTMFLAVLDHNNPFG